MAVQPNEPKQLAKTKQADDMPVVSQLAPRASEKPINLQHLTMNQLVFIGKAMAASGAFKDVKSQSQALIRILAGQEMGLGPFAAMSNISIIEGNATLGGHIMAARVKASPKYDYKVVKWEKDGCTIDFYEDGKKIGTSSFDKEDAQAANLLGKFNWKAYPRNMYFNRAISNGVRTYCPDVLGAAPVYDPDELGAQTDDNGRVTALPQGAIKAESLPVDEPVDSVDNSEVEEDVAEEDMESETDEVPVEDDTDLSQAIDDTLAEDRVDMPKKPVYGGRPDSGLPRPQQRKYYKEITAGTSATALKEAAQDVINKDTPTTYDDFEAMINFITTGELPGQQDLLGDEE